jgi:hypothetical protein
MSAVYSLRPSVTRDEAAVLLQGRGLSRIIQIARGPLRRIAPVYIPFRAYVVRIRNAGRDEAQAFAVDAVTGALDAYRLTELPDRDELLVVESRNCVAAALDAAATRQQAVDKVTRVLFQTGFFRLRGFTIAAEPAALSDIHVPYWVGFFGARERARLAVLDAVRRRPEGARVRRIVEEWIVRRGQDGDSPLSTPNGQLPTPKQPGSQRLADVESGNCQRALFSSQYEVCPRGGWLAVGRRYERSGIPNAKDLPPARPRS